jgi:rRNA maturation RNase YbeY
MVIEITHRQTDFRIDETRLRGYAEWIMKQIAELSPDILWHELSLVLTDDSIRDLNRTWFGNDTVTDVISFPYPEEGFGEVIVNLTQAKEEGELRESPDHELALYIAHGCHHLTGAEDDTPEKKAAMLNQESEWVKQAPFRDGAFFL